jgi:hypothetical protein
VPACCSVSGSNNLSLPSLPEMAMSEADMHILKPVCVFASVFESVCVCVCVCVSVCVCLCVRVCADL